MRLRVIQGGENLGYSVNCPILIGDIVKITNDGNVFPTFKKAFKWAWGYETDDFHTSTGFRFKDYYGTFGNCWKVLKFFIHHSYEYEIILVIKNRYNEKLLIGSKGVKVIKRASPKIEQPNFIERLVR